MSFLTCKNCGCESVSPMEVMLSEVDDLQEEDFLPEDKILEDGDKESRFYTCQVCGDNWLSVKQQTGGECEITFIHQMGIKPTLRRVAIMATSIILNEDTVDSWDYYFGEDIIEEEDWYNRLRGRRQVLKSICTN